VITASPSIYQVEVGNNRSHTIRISSAVSIWESRVPEPGTYTLTCTCLVPDDHEMVCKHAVAALRAAGQDITSY
jgi:hypothetical protein